VFIRPLRERAYICLTVARSRSNKNEGGAGILGMTLAMGNIGCTIDVKRIYLVKCSLERTIDRIEINVMCAV
jgi:hypothetical protein